MGLNVDHVLTLKRLDDKINELYDKRKIIVDKIYSKIGDKPTSFELSKEDNGKKFIRITITDIAKEVTEGKTVYKAAGFSRFDAKIDLLKNKPKD